MKVKVVDLSKTLKPYSNEWIILDPNTMKVFAAGKKADEVLDQARKRGIINPILTRAPQNYGAYIL